MTKSATATTTPISSFSSSLLLSSNRCGQQQQPQHQPVPKRWTRPESTPPHQQQQEVTVPAVVTVAPHDAPSFPAHQTTRRTRSNFLDPHDEEEPPQQTSRSNITTVSSARVTQEQGGGGAVRSSTPALANQSTPGFATRATIPSAIGRRPSSPGRNMKSCQNVGTKRTKKHRRETPRGQQASIRATQQNCWNDPLAVALSTNVQEYLASRDITTAAQFLLAPTTEVAQQFPEWRRQQGMAPLHSDTGHLASVSVWKRKVRVQAALVGAYTLARVNEGTNLKPVVREDDERNEKDPPIPLPVITDKHVFKRVAKKISVPPVTKKRLPTEDGGGGTTDHSYVTPYTDAMKFGLVQAVRSEGHDNSYVIQWDDGEEEELPIEDVLDCIEEYHTHIQRDPRGWRKEVIGRTNKMAHTTYDRYFLTPDQRYKLRSVVEVQKFQAALLVTGGDEPKAKKLFRKIKIIL